MDAGRRSAPDIGVFYFEDAVESLRRAGFAVGEIGLTMPPRERRRFETEGAMPSPDEIVASVKMYRVARCAVRGDVCDLLLTCVGGYALRTEKAEA